MDNSVTHKEALKRMRDLTANNIPFSFGFITYNSKNAVSKGYRLIGKGLLRASMRPEQSDKSDVLIAYLDCDDSSEDKNRFFSYPLLMMFNGKKVQI